MSTFDLPAGESNSRTGYLIDVDGQEREKEVVRRFCATPFLLEELLLALGVPGGSTGYSWKCRTGVY
jgi:hypothetical protein